MKKSWIVILIVFAASTNTRAVTIMSNSEEEKPAKQDQAVSQEDAQQRAKPQEDQDHVRIIPFYFDKKPTLQKKLKNGTHVYKVEPSPQHYSAGLRVGPYYPSYLKADTPGLTYRSIYGSNNPVLFNFDFEYQFFQKAGKLGLKTGLGFFTAQGNGRFARSEQTIADETFSLYVFPLNLSAVYRLQIWDRQILVPFGEAGGDYFGMMEYRPDKDKFSEAVKYGGVPAWHWAAGAQIQLDVFDKEVLWQLDQETGINHIYLTVDYRQIYGLNSTFDFTASYYEGGILFEF